MCSQWLAAALGTFNGFSIWSDQAEEVISIGERDFGAIEVGLRVVLDIAVDVLPIDGQIEAAGSLKLTAAIPGEVDSVVMDDGRAENGFAAADVHIIHVG